MSNYYPIYLDIENKPILIVGGGIVALRKVETLQNYGALIRIVSPRIIPELQDMVNKEQCEWIAKEYAVEDIQDSLLIFSCTEKEEVNAQVALDAKANNIAINVVDDPDKCSFIVPSILTRGDLTIAISTAGSSPIVARQIRQELEGFYGDEMRLYLELLKLWRKEAKQYLPLEKRTQFLNKITDGEVLNYLKQGQYDQAKKVIEDCFRSLIGENKMKQIGIGTRDSKLALWQAQWVKDFLTASYPDIEFKLIPMKTKGDKILDIPLPKIGDKGLFTMELEQGLLSEEIDMAVHSLKDLPTELPEGLGLSTYCLREDPRDVFLSKEGILLKDLPERSVIGTSSLRRRAQLQCYRPDLAFTDLRGNLETRWRKLQESETMAGIVLAAAGIIRLGWEDRITEYLPEETVLPAVGQGVIAIEIASHRSDIRELLQPLNHIPTELAVRAERSFLRSLEGGCQVPIGGLASVIEGTIKLKGNITSLDGSVVLETTEEGLEPEAVGEKAAAKMKLLGAKELLAEIRQQMVDNN